jgi:hypothetical protein
VARIEHYAQGSVWIPQATFTVAGTPTDPTTITVKIKDPDGTVTTLGPAAGGTGGGGIVRDSAGVFKTEIQLDDAGYWHARFEGTGAATAAQDHQAIVDPSEFYESAQLGSRALVGLAETKDWLQQQNVVYTGDLELARVINDISERAHQEACREFKPRVTNPVARMFDVDERGWRYGIVEIGDLAAATYDSPAVPIVVEILDTDWTTVLETVDEDDYTLHPLVREAWEPIRRIEFSREVTRLRARMRVRVTGNWGFPSVPGNVRQAVLDAVAQVMDRDVEHYRQDLGPATGGEGTNVVIVGGRQPRMLSMPPASLAVLWDYRDVMVA